MISVAIMHTPGERSINVERMISVLPDPFIVKEEGRGAWDTAQRAWRSHDVLATHHIVLQDDAMLCKDFYRLACMVIQLRPFVPVSFFPIGAVAISLPVPMIEHWLQWCELYDAQLPRHDDVRLNKWVKSQGLRFTYSKPSLVQHGAFPSLLDHTENPVATDFVAAPNKVEMT